ncbi:MAG: ATP-binding protein [Chitinispirillaceae bacterium]|jgi:anti-anti-sigma factor|nr:ATP-binding protein [Chitinispirillaceae bacterium]
MKKDSGTCSVHAVPGRPGVYRVLLSGELDVTSMDPIEAAFVKLLDGQAKFAVADMVNVTAIASAALGKLLHIRQRFAQKQGDLMLAGLSIDLRIKLGLMGANKILRIYRDVRSALSAYDWDVRREMAGVTLTFPAHLQLVPPVRIFVRGVLRNKGYSERDCFRMETVVDEICNNAVQHGREEKPNDLSLRVGVSVDRVEIDMQNVSDPAKSANLRKHIDSMKDKIVVQSSDKRGRGLALVKMLSSELAADISDTGTTVHVIKVKEG